MNFLAIIPARYASTRFPGKPLADIGGKTMIRRVYEQASKAFEYTCVATDDERIFSEVKKFGGRVVMTSSDHRSGTDRCREALQNMTRETGMSFDVVVNVQGDEPFIDPKQLELLKSCFADASTQIATLVKPIMSNEDLLNPNHVKAILDNKKRAIYFSRSPIPFVRNAEQTKWTDNYPYLKHIGIYAYRASVLSEITALPPSPLEIAESLEQNRWIENGYSIRAELTNDEGVSIDTPEDLQKVLLLMKSWRNF